MKRSDRITIAIAVLVFIYACEYGIVAIPATGGLMIVIIIKAIEWFTIDNE